MDERLLSKMEPDTLLSIVNMKLRDEFEDLTALVRFYDLNPCHLEIRLMDHGYQYDSKTNQFKANEALNL